MSNYLAIATVTATLQRILQDTIQIDVEGARVTTVRPDNVGQGIPETGVNIFLYRVAPMNWLNQDLPGRRSTGELNKRPQIALELNYIISCYGNEVELEPQRLLGSVIRTMHSQRKLESEAIRNTLDDSSFRYLEESDLAVQAESIKFTPLGLSTDDLSTIWSSFGTSYSLSVAYQCSAVLIESLKIPRRALPVRKPIINASPQKPIIRKITSFDDLTKIWQSAEERLIQTNSTIAIKGIKLRGDNNLVRIGRTDAIPQEISDREIVLDLSTIANGALQAGVQGIQVVKRDERERRVSESNVFPFVLLPTLEKIVVEAITHLEEEQYAVRVSILVQPIIGKNQQLNLFLNSTTGERAQEYSFKIPRLEADSDRIITEISGIAAGEYLVRLQVDGVESLLTVDTDETSPNYQKFVAPLLVFRS